MNDGQITQKSEPFTIGPGNADPEDSSTAPENNVNLENWSQDRDPSAIGKTAIMGEAGSLPLPPTEKPNLPADVNNLTPESFATAPTTDQDSLVFGKVALREPASAADTPVNLDPATVADDPPTNYVWERVMTGDRLSKNTVKKLEGHVNETMTKGNWALLENYMGEARRSMQDGDPNKSSIGQEAA